MSALNNNDQTTRIARNRKKLVHFVGQDAVLCLAVLWRLTDRGSQSGESIDGDVTTINIKQISASCKIPKREVRELLDAMVESLPGKDCIGGVQ